MDLTVDTATLQEQAQAEYEADYYEDDVDEFGEGLGDNFMDTPWKKPGK